MSRGIRNNNPGNIRHGPKWLGLSSEQTDPEYSQFRSPVYGIRAMVKLLRNYQTRHGLKTIEEIITRWAPPSENITGAYVKHVASDAGVDPRAEIDVNDYLTAIVTAIIEHENGRQPYTPAQIAEGIRLAG